MTDMELLEFVKDFYYASDFEEAHSILADIAYDGEVEESALYEQCCEGEYKMPETMRECALSLYESRDDFDLNDDDAWDHHGGEE